MYILAKAKKKIERYERLILNYGKTKLSKNALIANLYQSKRCFRARTLRKQLTYKCESTNHSGKKLNISSTTPKNKLLKVHHFCKLTSKIAI